MKQTPINIHSGSKRKDRPSGGFYVEQNAQTTKALDAANGLNPACCQGGTIVAIQDTTTREKAQNGKGWSEDGTSYTLDAAATQGVAIPFDTTQITSPANYSAPKQGDPCHPISAGAHPPAVAYGIDEETLKARQAGGGFEGAVAVDCYNQTLSNVAIPIRSKASDIDHTGGVLVPTDAVQVQCASGGGQLENPTAQALRSGAEHNYQFLRQAMAVRRLTPKECERLQGFPDNHTLIPWRGKPAEQCPDGPRYKALGNSMAVPCMAWIGSRIAAQESEPLRYLSVCSGIEAASMAWESLGWQPAAFAEVEKFPSAVLTHHWPQVPNMGDMNNHEQWDLPAIDVLVGGTPCQSFSVAGLRKGLRDPRGGLMLTFLEIAQRRRPRWIVWENVPGVLSSHGGRDFGAFLGALGALGYGWAYRVLDAQWFGVAQRRRRVFVVANLGDGAAAAKVLFESESVRRNPAPSREAGERTAATLVRGSKRSGGIGYDNQALFSQNGDNFVRPSDYPDVCDTVKTLAMRESGQGYWMQDEVAGSLRAEGENRPSRPSNVIASGLPDVVGTLSDGAHQGGGLNGQDAYTGRIFACARQPAHGADGQGHQHDTGRGADGDCLRKGAN
jgi:site-specific DNA-cytosine methylase